MIGTWCHDGPPADVPKAENESRPAYGILALLVLALCFFALSLPKTSLAATQLSDEMIVLEPSGPFTYRGAAITPVVKVRSGGLELEEGRDYVVSFANNTEVGTARVIVTGKGDWTGRARRDFTVNPIDIDGAQVTFATVPVPYVEGQEFDPPMQVTSGALLLERDRDYTMNAVLAGGVEAVVTLKGQGNFSGTKTVYVDAVSGVRVTFVDGFDQTVLKTQAVAVGSSAIPPATPTHKDRIFAGWTAAYNNVRENLRVEGVYLEVSEDPRTVAPLSGDTASARRVVLADGTVTTLLNDVGSVLSSGWRIAGGKIYYAGANGLAAHGLVWDGDKRYFLGADGTRQTGWVSDPDTGARYYARPEDGSIVVDAWFNDGYGWYYASENGTMLAGWMWRDGAWYWMNTEPGLTYGQMAFGWRFIDGAWYWFDNSGAMGRDRWVSWNGAWYWILSDGTMAQNRWVLARNWFYFLDGGAQATGWAWDGGGWYYLDANNGMLTDTRTPDGCYVGSDGRWRG